MKVIIKKQDTDKKFYNELLYVSSKYKNLIKNPFMIVHGVTSLYMIYIPIGVLLFIALILIMLRFKWYLIIILLLQLVIYFALSIYYLISSIKFINSEYNSDDKREITINNSGVRLVKGKNVDYRIGWSDLEKIIINHYSITFLPKTKSSLIIGVNSAYKEDIIKAIHEEKKIKLIIDNSDLYK